MKLKHLIFLFTGMSLLAAPLQQTYAQDASVRAYANESRILIGDQLGLFLEVKPGAPSDKIAWATAPDSIAGLEIVEKGKIDTIRDGHTFSLRQRLLVTGFDSGTYYVPPFHFRISSGGRAKDYVTDSVRVMIQTVPVDTTKAFKPIKEIREVGFSIWEYWKEIVAALLLIGLIVFVILYFVRNRASKMPGKTAKIPSEKAHEKALRLLRELQAKQYMQQGKGKEYFSEISDIVRTYLEDRFAVTALEQTTDELLALLKKLTDNKAELRKVRPQLKLILRTADLAKFAKANPLPDEYEACYAAAVEVVQRTRLKEEEGVQ